MYNSEEDKHIPGGTVHDLPQDLRKVLADSHLVLEKWNSITPLARNEWICWIEDAKRSETRAHRIARMCGELAEGKRRPCCWPGCPHRK